MKPFMRRLCTPFFVLSLGTLHSCNSVFYQPDPREFVTPERVKVAYKDTYVTTPDNVRLRLWHMKPQDQNSHKGVVVQFHGNGENMTTHFLSAIWLTMAGFDVISFDYRGYGGSDSTSPTRDGLLVDARTIFHWVAAEPKLKTLPLFVLGQSLGAAVAIPVIAESAPANLRGIVVDSSFGSYRQIARQKLGSVWLTWPLQWPLCFLVSDSHSPIDVIAKIQAPFLFVHAPTDPVVPYELGRELFAAAQSTDKVFWDISLGGHTAAFAEEDSPYREQLVHWLDQHTTSTHK